MVVGDALRYAELLSEHQQSQRRLVRQHRWLRRRYSWYNSSYGVRPALYFPSTLWVSTEDEGEAGFCLADVPLDDLLAEIKSRAEE